MAPERIRAGLVAFCAGDALGAPWEGKPPSEIDPARVDELPARAGWPRGATSDDTMQTLLVANELVRSGGEPDPARFLEELTGALPTMRGAGPTTRAAVLRWRNERTPYAPKGEGDTNGGAMRALPIGFATAPGDVVRRRYMAERVTRTTHGDDRALAAVCAVAAMAACAVAGAPLQSTLAAAVDEAGDVLAAAQEPLARAAGGAWTPPPDGIPLDSLPTVAAVISVLARGDPSPGDAIRAAIALGGDTDTVAALAGGIAAARSGGLDGIDWLDAVVMPAGEGELAALANALGALQG